MDQEKHPHSIEFKAWGERALFTIPATRAGGEKCTYQIPTYEAIKGITESIYWKPTITWIIDSVRVMNKIQKESVGIKTMKYDKPGSDLSYYLYLVNVEYQVKAHFEWNMQREDLRNDWNSKKHLEQSKKRLLLGGTRGVYLGTSECFAYVEPCTFGEGISHYDNVEKIAFGTMYHGLDYLNDGNVRYQRLWKPVMKHGIIDFKRPEECHERNEVTNL